MTTKNNQMTATITLPVSNDCGKVAFSDVLAEVQRRFDRESSIKNAAFHFLIDRGLNSEFHKHLHTDKSSPKTKHVEVTNIPGTIAEAMRTATISDQTRDYLILLGKLSDLHDEASDLLTRDYGASNAENRLGVYADRILNASLEVEKWLIYSITNQMCTIGSNQI